MTVEDDPGRDLGEERQIGHRFFFSPEEVEPLPGMAPPRTKRILVAGIGNVFMGDDGFGVEVAGQLLRGELPDGVHVEDYGIRGMDLDLRPPGVRPRDLRRRHAARRAAGTLYVIQPDLAEADAAAPEAHGMDPVKVLALAGALGDPLPRVLVVGCEPATRMTGEEDEVVAELSEPVRAAVPEAARMVEKLIEEAQEQ